MRDRGDQLTIEPVATMMNHATNQLFFSGLELPEDALIGEAGEGFRYILTGMNAERMLIASECIGDGRFLVGRAVEYAREREVFGRPIGANQGVQFPLARAHMALEAAEPDALEGDLRYTSAARPAGRRRTWRSSWLPRRRSPRPTRRSTRTAASASPREYDVERKFRETRLYSVAPVSNNLVQAYVGQHVLGLPRSY